MTAAKTRRHWRRLASSVVLGTLLLLVPDAAALPASWSVLRLDSAKAVDFEEGVVWVLAIGSDAKPGSDVLKGRADAIELVAINFETGSAVALGIPRDSYVDLSGDEKGRINEGLIEGEQKLMATLVEELTGIAPQYVVVAGLDAFSGLVDSIGGIEVRSDQAFHDLSIERGHNHLTGEQATNYARLRYRLPGGDFDRIANHQGLLKAILDQIRSREDEEGFIERNAVEALRSLDTTLGPIELYRFAQALTQIQLKRATTCVIGGTSLPLGGAEYIDVDEGQARRLADDASDDARLKNGCDG